MNKQLSIALACMCLAGTAAGSVSATKSQLSCGICPPLRIPGGNPCPRFSVIRPEATAATWSSPGTNWACTAWTLPLRIFPCCRPTTTWLPRLSGGARNLNIVTQGVTVHYRILGNTTSADKTNFWQYAQALFGLSNPLPANIGLTGKGLRGTMDPAGRSFHGRGHPGH